MNNGLTSEERTKLMKITAGVLLSTPIINRVGKLIMGIAKQEGKQTTLAVANKMSKVKSSAVTNFLKQEGLSPELKRNAQRAQLMMALYENKTTKNVENAKKLINAKSSQKRKDIRFNMAVETIKWATLATIGLLLFSQLKKIVTFKSLQTALQTHLDKLLVEQRKSQTMWEKAKNAVSISSPVNTFMLRVTDVALQCVSTVTGTGVDLGMVLYFMIMVSALFFRKITAGRKVSVGLTGVSFENVTNRGRNTNVVNRALSRRNNAFNSLMKTIGTSSSSNRRLVQM